MDSGVLPFFDLYIYPFPFILETATAFWHEHLSISSLYGISENGDQQASTGNGKTLLSYGNFFHLIVGFEEMWRQVSRNTVPWSSRQAALLNVPRQ